MEIIVNIWNKIKSFFKRGNNKYTQKDSPFHTLTPIDNVENGEVYEKALEYALSQESVTNIAITGPYGSGKSSVIKSFFKSKKYKTITLSLASFRDCSESKNFENGNIQREEEETINNTETTSSNSHLQRLIEISILQQLFYHEKDCSIPDSKFKKIKRQPRWKLILFTIGGILFFVSVLYLFFPNFLKLLIAYDVTHWGANWNWFHYIAPICCFGVIAFALYKISRVLIGISIKKLNIKTAEIEIDQKIDKSILNSHIDEIIYFFEATKYNVVIIEDLDRFEQTEIFVKLREMNRLINNCNKINRKITFIYALKDEVFADKDRTKFFDFILPVIPIINYSNSGEILRKCLSNEIQSNEKTRITEKCIDNISIFVNDMRLLYNIINEYHIYSKKINKDQNLEKNRLLSIITYKNLYPKDFTDLAENKGKLYDAIHKKSDLIISDIKLYNQQIDEYRKRIGEAEKQWQKDIKELRLLYIGVVLAENNVNSHTLSFDGKKVSIFNYASNDEYFNAVESGCVYYMQPNSYPDRERRIAYNFNDIERKVDPNQTYQQKLQAIQDKNSVDAFENQIREFEEKRDSLYKKSLSELWTSQTKEKQTDNSQEAIIDVFIGNGYINENYYDYISIFHEGSLSRSDGIFLINVKRGIQNSYDYSLNQVENVYKKLDFYNFERPATLNYDLANYLIKQQSETNAAKMFVKQLANESDVSIDFLNTYITVCANPAVLFEKLCAKWSNIWHYVNAQVQDQQIKEQYFHFILKYANLKDIVQVFDQNESVIAHNPNFLKTNIEHSRILKIIKALNIRFTALNTNLSQEDFQFIRQNRLFDFNPEVIRTLIPQSEFDVNAYSHKNYTYLSQLNDNAIINNVNEHLNEYISNVWLKLNSTDEDESYFIQLVNSTQLEFSLKEQVVEKVNVKIQNIENVSDSKNWDLLFLYLKVSPTWGNIRAFSIANKGLNGAVLTCLNDTSYIHQLTQNTVPQKESYEQLSSEIISLEKLPKEIYTKLIRCIPWKYKTMSTDLSKENVQMLIDNHLFDPSLDTYMFIKENYNGLHIDFLIQNFDEFQSKLLEMQFDKDDLKLVLSTPKIKNNQLQQVVNSINNDTIEEDYVVFSKLMEQVVQNKVVVNNDILADAMTSSAISQDARIKLFNSYHELIKDEVEDFLDQLGNPYNHLTDTSSHVTYVPNNDYEKRFIEILLKLGLISSFSEEDNRIKVNHKRS